MTPIRANGLLWAQDVWCEALKGLKANRTVTAFRLEPARPDSDAPVIDFEVVIKRVGGVAVPRVTQHMADKAAREQAA